MKIVQRVLLAVLFVMVLVPFFAAAPAAHPATDDFTFAAYTHATWEATGSLPHVLKDAVSYTLRTWRDWQGTMTGILVMALNPAVFTLEFYWVHAVVLLVLCLAAWFVFLRRVMRRMGLKDAFFPVYCVLTAVIMAFLPDMVEGVYWFNGAWFYMGAQAAALITLALCDRFAETPLQGGRKKAFAAVCGVLLFALGMNNYITAMMTAAALMMMALLRVYAAGRQPKKGAVTGVQLDGEWQEHFYGGPEAAAHELRAAKRTALFILPIAAGLLISVLAPGNAVRMAADGAHESGFAYLGEAVVRTLLAAAGYFLRFALRTPVLAALWLLTPCICRAMDRVSVRRDFRTPPMAVTAVGAYLILCAMIIPHMYASGNAGSGRVVNMYHCYVLMAFALCWLLFLQRMKPQTRGWLLAGAPRAVTGAIALAALAVCLLSGQHGHYVKLIRDWRDGTQDAYIAQYRHEYALCEAAGAQEDVFLPEWTVQTLTGKPTASEDPAFWTSESMATYFGVKSVRVGEKPQEAAAEEAAEAEVTQETAVEETAGEAAAAEVSQETAVEETAGEAAAAEVSQETVAEETAEEAAEPHE